MPTTVDYWDVDGYSLNEYTRNLDSWGGSREAPPPLRGSNQQIPYMYGTQFVEKVPDRRSMVLKGWISAERNGVESVANLKQNWREFRTLLWRPDEEFLLTKRWRDANGVAMAATAKAQYVSGLEPEIDNLTMKFEVTLELADPFFYGPEITVAVPLGDTAFVPKGDYPSKKLKVLFANAQSGMAVSALINGVIDNTITYTSTVAGATATIDIEKFRATELLSGATTKTSSKVGHSGRAQWLWLPKKMTHLRFARTSGSGTATIKYQPAWH